jgi:hypothetical protein
LFSSASAPEHSPSNLRAIRSEQLAVDGFDLHYGKLDVLTNCDVFGRR